MATFIDNFYIIDPYSPPDEGATLTRYDFVVNDANSDGSVSAWRDYIDGSRVYSAYVGDTVTVQYADGTQQTITGVTFYLFDGREVFTPIDGSTLQDATFVSSTWTPSSTSVTNSQLQLACFVAGTRIRTPQGERPIETLRVGDRVVTLDRGAQPVRWIGRRAVRGEGDFAPILIRKGAIGNRRDLLVSPQHRMLVSGWRAELLFGESELLVAAKHLVNGRSILPAPCDEVEYVHLMFDRHEVILAEGAASESFHPGDFVLAGDRALMVELTSLFPELRIGRAADWPTARTVLRSYEAAALVA